MATLKVELALSELALDHPLLLTELPLEVLRLVMHHCSTPSLCTLNAVCRLFAAIANDASEELWRPRLAADFPLFGSANVPPKRAYAEAHRGLKVEVQVMNPQLREGTYGATTFAVAQYFAGPKAMLVQRPAGPARGVPSQRVRRAAGLKEFAPLPTFATLLPGMCVELQWKSKSSVSFNWWFALVHQVLSEDEVQLLFPQYGGSLGGGSGFLTGVSTLLRARETYMHGGIAGGIRIPTGEETVQWWRVLASDEHDVEVERRGEGREPLQGDPAEWPRDAGLLSIRGRFLAHLPSDQPAQSLQIAGVCSAVRQRVDALVHAGRLKYEPETAG